MKHICKKHLAIYLLLAAIGSFLSASVNAQAVITSIGIESDTNQTDVPVTFGQIFKKDDVPAGNTLQGKLKLPNGDSVDVELQVDKKATHADGSLRHAIFSLKQDLVANQEQKITLSSITNSGGNPTASDPQVIMGDNFNAAVEILIDNDTSPASPRVKYTASPRAKLFADNDDGYDTWLEGDVVSEWLVVEPLRTASGDEHPHLMARFYVRAYHQSPAKVRVSVVVENNWTFQSTPSNLTYNVDIKMAGESVFQQSDLTHFHHARWRKVFWYGAADPDLNIIHDASYMMASKVIPNYNPKLSIPEGSLVEMKSAWEANDELMAIGLASAFMPGTGAHIDIGPLPRWTVRYLLSMDKRAREAAIGTGVQAGSWSIHYRDKDTGLPVSILDKRKITTHPNNISGQLGSDLGDVFAFDITEEEFIAASVSNGAVFKRKAFELSDPSFDEDATDLGGPVDGCVDDNDNDGVDICQLTYTADTAHQPSLSFVPYMVTGDYYHLEELHFWATSNLLRTSFGFRGGNPEGSGGLLDIWQQVRGQAWTLRTLGHAAYITPDDPDPDSMKNYFTTMVENNLSNYQSLYVNNNQYSLGFLNDPYISKNNGRGIAPWMDDFFTWTVGYLVGLGFTDAGPLLEWKAKFPVGRMTTPDFCWVYSALYTMNIRNSNNDPFYVTFSDLYTKNVPDSVAESSCGSQAMVDANNSFIDSFTPNSAARIDPDTSFTRKLTTQGEIGGLPAFAAGFVSNMQPALAIAAELGVPGASEAWYLFDNRAIKPDYTSGTNPGYLNWEIVPPPTLDFTIGSNQWNMLSLPCEPAASANTVADIFADDFAGVSGNDWAVYTYVSADDLYVRLDNPDTLEQGVGYWVIQVDNDDRPATIDVPESCLTPASTLTACPGSANGCFDIPLATAAGNGIWDLIGYPFTEALAWNRLSVIDNDDDSCGLGCSLTDAQVKGVFFNEGWHYNPSIGSNEKLKDKGLSIWQGFWVATGGDGDGKSPRLLIPVD